MNSNRYNRETFLKKSGAAAVVIATGTTATNCSEEVMPRNIRFSNLDEALAELAVLEKAPSVKIEDNEWSLGKILAHCAQSIEYSMQGFPEKRSIVVRGLIGPLVFSRFASKGAMSHNLSEPILGAPEIPGDTDQATALARLRKSISDFRAFEGETREHFAFGKLSKAEYEKAHAFHIANHLSQMTYG